jgi:hypothetical protein
VTAFGMVLAGIGVFLLWCAVKGEDPREVLRGALGGTPA